MKNTKPVKRNTKQINIQATPELVNTLDEIVEFLRDKSEGVLTVTRTDAIRYLAKLWDEKKANLNN